MEDREGQTKRQRRIELLVAVAAGLALVAAAATVAVVHSSNGGSSRAAPRDDVGTFVVTVVSEIVHNDYTDAWATLNPDHQRVAPRPEYVKCEQLNPIKMALNKVEVLSVANRWFAMAGHDQPVHGKELKLRITLADPLTEARAQSTHVFHAVAVGSHWTWVLPASAYELYRSDSCS